MSFRPTSSLKDIIEVMSSASSTLSQSPAKSGSQLNQQTTLTKPQVSNMSTPPAELRGLQDYETEPVDDSVMSEGLEAMASLFGEFPSGQKLSLSEIDKAETSVFLRPHSSQGQPLKLGVGLPGESVKERSEEQKVQIQTGKEKVVSSLKMTDPQNQKLVPAMSVETSMADEGRMKKLPDLKVPPMTMESHDINLEDYTDYPPPIVVLNNTSSADDLAASNVLDSLKMIPFEEVRGLGPMHLPPNLGNVILSPYDQVVLGCASLFYSTLPPIGYSPEALSVIHYVARHELGRESGSPPEHLARHVQLVMEIGLSHLTGKVGQALLDPSVLMTPGLTDVVGIQAIYARIELTKREASFAYTFYDMIGHLVVGGRDCIEPVPLIIKYNSNVEQYVNKIAVGDNIVGSLHVALAPRSAALPVARYQPSAVSYAPASSSTETKIPSKKAEIVFRPPGWTGQKDSKREVEDLLKQGDPTGPNIIRDTTGFREDAQASIELEARMVVLEAKMNQLLEAEAIRKVEEDKRNALIAGIANAVRGIQDTLTIMTAQSSISNLADRNILNRSLIPPQSHEGQTSMAANPPLVPIAAQGVTSLIHKLGNFKNENPDPQELIVSLQELLKAGKYANFAACLKPASFESDSVRSRLINILKMLPRN